MVSSRDDFSKKTIETLAKRAGHRCSSPTCRKPTTGPRIEPTKAVNIGVAAHITAAAPGGPRYDPGLTPAQRRDIENGIWLCQNCAELIDDDPGRYPADLLRRWRMQAEQVALDELEHGVAPQRVEDFLACAVAAYEARMYQLLARFPFPRTEPYKSLYAFEIEDADIFFGRDADTEALHKALLRDRLTILHARSGAGKTSLLNAGLAPRLIREGRLPVYARVYRDPIHAVKGAILSPSPGPWPRVLDELTLHEFLGLVCAHRSHRVQELVLILDQFEEFFVFWPERGQRGPFLDALADCYDDKGLPVRFLLSIRGDYFTDLATFENRLPHVFHNEYRLEAMAREDAERAIAGPVSKIQRAVTFEPALMDTLLDDLARGGQAAGQAEGVELPHLQLVCARLFEDLAAGDTTITLAGYEAVGKVEGVLARHLQQVLDRIPGTGRDLAKAVLAELVSSKATKRVLSRSALAAKVEVAAKELDDVLARLVNARLVRPDEVSGEIVYELAHEYLIGEIGQWLDEADLALKQAEELLTREVANWRAHGLLIPLDRLRLLYAHRERFRGLDEETWHCLLRSSLEVDFAPAEWAGVSGKLGERLLLTILHGAQQRLRLRTTGVLGEAWGSPEISNLGNKDRLRRSAAARALERIKDPRAIEPLIAALNDDDRMVRLTVVEVLGESRDPRVVEPLLATLHGEDRVIRCAAAEALGKIGDARAVESLVATLIDHEIRKAALESLRKIGVARAVESLIVALKDENWRVCQSAAEALGEIGDARAVEPLIAALGDKELVVRRAAAEALGRIGDTRAVEPLIVALKDEDENENVRLGAVESLRKIGDAQAVKPLIVALGDEEFAIGRAAAEALGEIGGAQAVEPLIAELGDENWDVRQLAAEALGEIGDTRAVEPLVAALMDHETRKTALVSLRKIGDTRAMEPLIVALGDEDWGVRQLAAWALGGIGDARATERLLGALGDEEFAVRRAAAEALGEIGDARATEPLIATLENEEDDELWWVACEAVGKIHNTRAVEPLTAALGDEDYAVRRAPAEESGEINDTRALEPLIAALKGEDENVRQSAEEALGEIGDPRALKPLIAAMKDEDLDVDVRRAAAEALPMIGGTHVVEPLIAGLGSESWVIRQSVTWALGGTGDARAVESLIAALDDANEDVRRTVAEALRRIGTPEALAALRGN